MVTPVASEQSQLNGGLDRIERPANPIVSRCKNVCRGLIPSFVTGGEMSPLVRNRLRVFDRSVSRRWIAVIVVCGSLSFGMGIRHDAVRVFSQEPLPLRSVPTRQFTAPVPLESLPTAPMLVPRGTVPPLAIGPAPGFPPPPVVFGPPPRYLGPPVLAPAPFLPAQPVGPVPGVFLPPQPLPQSASYPPLTPVPELSPPRADSAVVTPTVPANVRVAASEEFLNRLVAREEVLPGPVRDFVLGAEVTGRQTTTARLKLDLLPAADKARVAFVLHGDVQSLTTGVTPQAMVDVAGRQQFVAVKDVFFDGHQFSTRHATVFVRGQTQTLGAMTPLSGSLIGGIADRIAYRAAERRKPEAEAIARDRVAERLYPMFDGEIDKQLSFANQLLEQQVRKRLELAGLVPASQSVSTTNDRLLYQALIGRDAGSSAAAQMRLCSLGGDGGVNIALHESLLNDLIGRAGLKGLKTTDKELKQQMDAALALLDGVLGRRTATTGGTDPVSNPLANLDIVTDIEFDETDPLSIRFEQDRMLATIKAHFKPAGQNLIPPMTVELEYRFIVDGNTLRLVAETPRAVAQDRSDPLAEPTLAEQAIQKAVEAALPVLEFDRMLPARHWKFTGPAPRVTSIKSQDGWCSIAID